MNQVVTTWDTSADGRGPADVDVADRLEAVILLAGQVRATPLSAAIERSLLDLPVADDRTLLDLWRDEVARLAEELGREALVARVVIDRAGTMPEHVPNGSTSRVDVRMERDPYDFRGTAGVLRDVSKDYAPDSWVLVVSAAQLPLTPLSELLAALRASGGDFSLLSHAGGMPMGTMLVRCGCLTGVADVGYVDMKEQALPQIRLEHRVTVVSRTAPTALPVRSVADYVQALRVLHGGSDRHNELEDPYAERWRPTFTIVEEGAHVEPGSHLQDSVVLRGGVVEGDAIVVRSVVCPGGRVRRRERVVGRLVARVAGP
jgi:NDP-sugar pyrophosphorylase family protein